MKTHTSASGSPLPIAGKAALINQLTEETGSILYRLGDGAVSAAAYDTAWVARIPLEHSASIPMFPQCLSWLQEHQYPDGSWGGTTTPEHYYDKVICTLSAVTALKVWQDKGIPLNSQIDKGVNWLNRSIRYLHQNRYRTVGFEILFHSLFNEARESGLPLVCDDVTDSILAIREVKLKKINLAMLFEGRTTLLHSLEGIPHHEIDWDKVLRLRDNGGSFLASPSATAFVYLHTGNRQCLAYLHKIVERFGYVPAVYPIDIFETGWCLEIISRLRLEQYFATIFQNKLKLLQSAWSDTKGASWSSVFDLPDLDDTAVVYYLLSKNNLHPRPEVFDRFYANHRLFCFPGELDSSPTHLLHFLHAYDGDNAALVQSAREQLQPLLSEIWTDKWHLSPYYLTSLAIEPLLPMQYTEAAGIPDFVLKNQLPDGGWGPHISSPEETGWACMTLLLYLPYARSDKPRVMQSLQKGIRYLESRRAATPAASTLWLEKCLYTPYNIVNTLLGAVILKYHLIEQTTT